jgi:hypothetical protein
LTGAKSIIIGGALGKLAVALLLVAVVLFWTDNPVAGWILLLTGAGIGEFVRRRA